MFLLLLQNLRHRWHEWRLKPTYQYADTTLVQFERMVN